MGWVDCIVSRGDPDRHDYLKVYYYNNWLMVIPRALAAVTSHVIIMSWTLPYISTRPRLKGSYKVYGLSSSYYV